ncbi:MAG TPA: VOC family protein [Candidatus Limnocylindrales bacterium]|nr:VOC family protein [Candidatus Limnocylindrales bacterium]
MHRSRLATIVIDCADTGFETGAKFWSAALGKPVVAHRQGNDRFASLKGRVGGDAGLYIGLQRVPAEERAVHLDIETDDVDAEVARLEQLGARVKARIRRHVVMTAPSGHAFCVVPVQRGDFPHGATEWP